MASDNDDSNTSGTLGNISDLCHQMENQNNTSSFDAKSQLHSEQKDLSIIESTIASSQTYSPTSKDVIGIGTRNIKTNTGKTNASKGVRHHFNESNFDQSYQTL